MKISQNENQQNNENSLGMKKALQLQSLRVISVKHSSLQFAAV
jgi:hypothetical protein